MASPEPGALGPGESRQITIDFHGSGDFSCEDGFELKLAAAVTEAGAPVALDPLRFAARGN
jgi:hypothetical protein